jgi:sulfatase modifying factor 1
MKTRTLIPFVAVSFAALTFIMQMPTQGDTFGSGANAFSLDFVNIGNAGNAADTTGYGAVPYEYRIGKYEISQDAIDKATASGMANVTAGAWTGNQPAANINWYEAAAFVNWLNTSTGHQAAYNLTFSGSWSMTLWSSGDAWQAGGENLYRHKGAFYFLPNDDEWYKAAFYNAGGTNYFLYATGEAEPISVASGADVGTAVFNGAEDPAVFAPAGVDMAGGLSAYGTMGQGGNVSEWIETAFDGSNDSATKIRRATGGNWESSTTELAVYEFFPGNAAPTQEDFGTGFRVASVPEPSTYALLAMSAAGALLWARRKRKN